jgi:hypothetical protein
VLSYLADPERLEVAIEGLGEHAVLEAVARACMTKNQATQPRTRRRHDPSPFPPELSIRERSVSPGKLPERPGLRPVRVAQAPVLTDQHDGSDAEL